MTIDSTIVPSVNQEFLHLSYPPTYFDRKHRKSSRRWENGHSSMFPELSPKQLRFIAAVMTDPRTVSSGARGIMAIAASLAGPDLTIPVSLDELQSAYQCGSKDLIDFVMTNLFVSGRA